MRRDRYRQEMDFMSYLWENIYDSLRLHGECTLADRKSAIGIFVDIISKVLNQ